LPPNSDTIGTKYLSSEAITDNTNHVKVDKRTPRPQDIGAGHPLQDLHRNNPSDEPLRRRFIHVDQSTGEMTIHLVFDDGGSDTDKMLDGQRPLVYANGPRWMGNCNTSWDEDLHSWGVANNRYAVMEPRHCQRHVRPPVAPRTEKDYREWMRSIKSLRAEAIRIHVNYEKGKEIRLLIQRCRSI
jgi:hypothetical protein